MCIIKHGVSFIARWMNIDPNYKHQESSVKETSGSATGKTDMLKTTSGEDPLLEAKKSPVEKVGHVKLIHDLQFMVLPGNGLPFIDF